jgi:4-amino-4-deoxy-L-arabinose transferase-like glycosyltransferase
LPASSRSRTEWLLIFGFCAFLFFFGLNYFGLVGADEPRYAQVAREMLARRDWITPVFGGQPWLEKPVLYYWQAMLSYSLFGVSDWAARIPSALDASLAVIATYGFLWRFRPGLHLDGALMLASAAGMIGFARAASTDMPLAACLTIALLGWFAWYEAGSKKFLAAFYLFLALGVLAKGPVALVLAGLIILIFAGIQRNLGILKSALWYPGLILFGVVAMPWYVLVQVRNPEFFRVFILQHNLARFGTDLYHHRQPFWYFLPVMLIALIPWAILSAQAIFETVRVWWQERSHPAPSDDDLTRFLVIWLVTPVIFFSFSQSKLPGYVLPAVPAGILLVAEYTRTHIEAVVKPHVVTVVFHAVVAALPVIPALMINAILLHRLQWGGALAISCGLAVSLVLAIILTLRSGLGLRMLRFVTLVPVLLAVAAILKIGGTQLDETLSARPLAQDIARVEANYLPGAVFHVPREIEYGLAFYRNQSIANYDRGEVPSHAHLLVTREGQQSDIARILGNRRVSLLGTYPPQHIQYYWVAGISSQ